MIQQESQIIVTDLTKKIGETVIIDRVSFAIKKGEYVGLIGPNGAGKSTLLKILLGLETYTSGSFVIADSVRIGYVPQQYILSDHVPISVQEVVQMGLIARACNGSVHACINDAMHRVGLPESLLSKNFHLLSGGQKQRVIIARAIVSSPDILFCDEPLSGVDHASKIQIYNVLADINKIYGTTIIFVSHEIENIIERSDRVLCLNKALFQGCHPIDFAKNDGVCMSQKIEHEQKTIHHHHDNI